MTTTPSKNGFKRKFFHVLAKPVNKMLRRIYDYRLRNAPIVDNRLVFQSKPDYSDNAKAFYKYLTSHSEKHYDICWVLEGDIPTETDNEKGLFLKRKNQYDMLSYDAYHMMATARMVFATHRFAIPYSRKRAGQLFIYLGHGCGYKGKSYRDGHRFFDKAIVIGDLFALPQADYLGCTADDILSLGYPRSDWMLHPTEKARQLLQSIRKDRKKVIIWMPTFRNSITKISYGENAITAFPLMKDQADWQRLDAACREQNVVLIVKLHISQRNYDIDFSHLTNIVQMSNNDFKEAGVEMYEFLALTDALVSDYSSVAVDYLLTDHPLAFALDDYQLYKGHRGFIFEHPLDYMPGHHLYKLSDLIAFIADVTAENDSYAPQRQQVRAQACCDSPHYSQDLADVLGL